MTDWSFNFYLFTTIHFLNKTIETEKYTQM